MNETSTIIHTIVVVAILQSIFLILLFRPFVEAFIEHTTLCR